MEFIGTEVGIKIRSAIKAKLTELGKTVDDELIDYIMVMVANKKEESQMARDLQPFLESDTFKFTTWLHKVLQKLEQVTVIVTDEEFKIATTAFGKVSKKRKSTDSSSKKKSGSKDEPKEKKKKVKHEHGKHSKNASTDAVNKTLSTSNAVSGEKQPKSKLTGVVKTVKLKRSKTVVTSETSPANANNKKISEDAAKKVSTSVSSKDSVTKTSLLDVIDRVETSVQSQKLVEAGAENTAVTKSPTVTRVAPVQRPVMVMMMSDDDDDDDDFINIKTDVAEEDDLLDERAVAPSAVEGSAELPEPKVIKTRSVLVEGTAAAPSPQPVVNEELVRQALVVPLAPKPGPPASKVVLPAPRRALRRSPPHQRSPPDSAPRVSIMSRVGAVLKRKASNFSDEDEGESRNGSVASVVKVKPRPKVPAAAQAPKNLLLKAMADAQRSMATAPVREVPDIKSKRSPLFTRKFRDRQSLDMTERIAVTLPNVRDDPQEETLEEEQEAENAEPDEAYVPELVTTPSTVTLDVVYSPSPIAKPAAKPSAGPAATEQTQSRSTTPEFLVTLDGYKNYSSFSRTIVCETTRSVHDETEGRAASSEGEEGREQAGEEEEEEPKPLKPRRQKIVFTSKPEEQGSDNSDGSPSKLVAPKSLDRCRFWPACRLGDGCTFHHPTQTCKSFPSCPFGDRCLYIHPNCKFDASCTRKDCPFTHASPRNLAALPPVVVPVPAPRPVMQRLGGQTCRFFPNCSNTNCRFFHPKPCRYGRQCSKTDCAFSHSEIPPKEKMKWVSSVR